MADLTKRQLEVVRLVAQGHSDKSVARELGIAPKTVQAHLDVVASRLPGDGTRRMRVAKWANSSGGA